MLVQQSLAPYCVAILESGKVRAFMVRGSEIHEVTGTLPIEKLSSPADDPRVGWSRHVLNRRTEHEKGYFKSLSHHLLQLVSKKHATGLIVGCHEDLWGEVEAQFADLEEVLMGRFHLAYFDAEPSLILHMAMPVFAQGQRARVTSVLREINETPSRRAIGVKDVLEALIAGRVQKLVLDGLQGQAISECKACGQMTAIAGHNCVSCGNAEGFYLTAEEGLIRQALLTDAEIRFVETDTVPGFNGVTALLRY
jgi:peptide subunit release factor 1 (eRF1)